MNHADAQRELEGLLRDPADVHVTPLAAACLRAVDVEHVSALVTNWNMRELYRRIVVAARNVIKASVAPRAILCDEDRHTLETLRSSHGAAAAGDGWSLYARAVAQAVHDERSQAFWSYFADWTEPKKLADGDPVPVPTRVRLETIYAEPHLRCCPSPDHLVGPAELFPGGYRGLPALRLFDRPADCPAEVYLDPSLPESLCPLSANPDTAGEFTLIVPASDLRSAFDVAESDESGEPGFGAITPRDLETLQSTIVEAVLRSADSSALVIVPELATAPEVDDYLDRLHGGRGIGKLEVLVGGSAWRSPADGTKLGTNTAMIWPRSRSRHSHDKYSWFSGKAGQENIARAAPRITIMAGAQTTYTVLICRDALEPWVPALLQNLRVRLVLVPSCNPDVGPYVNRAGALAELGTSTVVLANLPPTQSASAEYGLVVRPAGPKVAGKSAQPEKVVISGAYSRSFHVNVRQSESFDIDRTVRRS